MSDSGVIKPVVERPCVEKRAAKKRLPSYLRRPLGRPARLHEMKKLLRSRGLHTVCESARCPNIGECFSKPTATFMILGDVCTRGCGFCSVKGDAKPLRVDSNEPENIAKTAKELGLKHVVITSVTRDDLTLGGAVQFADTVRAVRAASPGTRVEVLTPDFRGNVLSIDTVLEAAPDVFNHNVETVPRLYPVVRPEADFDTSLSVLERAANSGVLTKTGLMLGFGERRAEVEETLTRLYRAGCDAVTIGQYLRPSRENLEVTEYATEETFKYFEKFAKSLGIKYVFSGPFVRSSYNAGEMFE